MLSNCIALCYYRLHQSVINTIKTIFHPSTFQVIFTQILFITKVPQDRLSR